MQFNVKKAPKVFKPVTVELTFETQEELNWFYWITNCTMVNVEVNNAVEIDPREYGKIQMQLNRNALNLYKNN